MIDISFKAKSINTEEWVYSMTISQGTIKRKRGQYFFELNEGEWVGVIPETIGQYTGCPERDGDVIYGGDIVRHYTENEKGDCIPIDGEVKMINGCWCVGDERYPLFAFPNELIGNIHDKTK